MRVSPNAAQAANFSILQRQNAAQNGYRIMNRADATGARNTPKAQPSPTVAQFQPAAQAPTLPVAEPAAPLGQKLLNAPPSTRTPPIAPPAVPSSDPALQTYGDLHLAAVKNAFGAVKGDERYTATADANSDGVVDFNDNVHILSNWGNQVTGASDAPATYNEDFLAMVQKNMGAKAGDDRFSSASDANADGIVDFNDVIHVLSNWGKPVQTPQAPST